MVKTQSKSVNTRSTVVMFMLFKSSKRAFNGLNELAIPILEHDDLSVREGVSTTFNANDTIDDMPLIYIKDKVLFPSGTLAIRVSKARHIAVVEKALSQTPSIIGIISVSWDTQRYSPIGSTAEIRKYDRLENGWINVLVRGQERFHLTSRWNDIDGLPCGEIRVIVEDSPLRIPREHRAPFERPGESRAPCHNSKAVCPWMFWPRWAYEQHDSYCLAKKLSDIWESMGGTPSFQSLLRDPRLMSFQAADNIPFPLPIKTMLFETHAISVRILMQITKLEMLDVIKCQRCKSSVANRRDAFIKMGNRKVPVTLNKNSFFPCSDSRSDVMTLMRANGLKVTGTSSEKFTWFHGYAAAPASCGKCDFPMGWKLTATAGNSQLPYFWGVRNEQVYDFEYMANFQ